MSVKNTILPELTESDIRDFLSNVNRESGQGPHGRCWEWKGSKTVDTYGRFHYSAGEYKAHRVMWKIFNGPIPHGLNVLHSCDNPPCVNPDHLRCGTQKDNADDRESKKRGNHATGQRCGCYTMPHRVPRGESAGNSKLTEEQVLEIRSKYKTGKYLQRELAKEYGVSKTCIGSIITRVYWTHI